MAVILKFPGARADFSIRLRSRIEHRISVRVLDRTAPELVRWRAQFAMQRAGGFRALAGFTDRLARRGGKHTFSIRGKRLTRRFLKEVERLVLAGRIAVEIDGFAVSAKRFDHLAA